jgi:hypothetical protein
MLLSLRRGAFGLRHWGFRSGREVNEVGSLARIVDGARAERSQFGRPWSSFFLGVQCLKSSEQRFLLVVGHLIKHAHVGA